MLNKEPLVSQLDDVINQFILLRQKARYDDLSGNVLPEELTNTITRCKAAVQRITGTDSEYYKSIIEILNGNKHNGNKLREIMGIILALKADLEQGYLKTLSEIIQGNVFSDYLEISEHLLLEGLKDPAAVVIGSTLESHIKELSKNQLIPLDYLDATGNVRNKKTDTLNSDLTKKNVYPSSYQKQITAWLDIRNNAAHGEYTQYTQEQVRLMLEGVRAFLITYP